MSLVAHWKLDEPTGTDGADSIKEQISGNHGTPNSPVVSVSTPSGYGVQFDGIQYITAPNQIITSYPFSLSILNLRDVAASGGVMLSLGTQDTGIDSTLDIRLLTVNGKARMRTKNDASASIQPTAAVAVDAGVPSLVTGIWESSTKRDIYINGVFIDSSDIEVDIVDVPDQWTIGAKFTSSSFNTIFPAGILRDARIYDHALTAQEVADLWIEAMKVFLVLQT